MLRELMFKIRDEVLYSFQCRPGPCAGFVDLSRFGYKDVLDVGAPRYLTRGMGPVGFSTPLEDLCPCVHVTNCYWGQAAEDTCATGQVISWCVCGGGCCNGGGRYEGGLG